MSKIIVQVEGGLVQGAFLLKNSLFPNDKVDGVIVLDFDVEGADGDEITETRDKDGALLEAVINEEGIMTLPKGSDVQRLALAYLEQRMVVSQTSDEDLPLLMAHLTDEKARAMLADRLKGKMV
jgi:hypothetical protein